ncbi:DUF397 domain-containing protein [Actinomadura rugatobispora]|uniref:DUF397 domain-containing protein n=1 Tax=Actinomadura rugatobispora TaxID=1994 RepID=A0ABW1AD87_9ACTN|nr:hypothetical protein GCM10010200_030840 [Actinomadura rugatobispora]
MTYDISRAVWRKSSRSDTAANQCVEVARLGCVIAVRDSKAPDPPHLVLTAEAWAGLVGRIRGRGAQGREGSAPDPQESTM